MSKFLENIVGMDVNDINSATDWFKVEPYVEFMIFVERKTGTETTFETCVEISPDGEFNGGCFVEDGAHVKLQGSGYMHIKNTRAIEYLSVHCKTIEGTPATVDVYIQGFR